MSNNILNEPYRKFAQGTLQPFINELLELKKSLESNEKFSITDIRKYDVVKKIITSYYHYLGMLEEYNKVMLNSDNDSDNDMNDDDIPNVKLLDDSDDEPDKNPEKDNNAKGRMENTIQRK